MTTGFKLLTSDDRYDHCATNWLYFLNGPSLASFSFIFDLFQKNINTILQQINVKKCSSSIRHWDSNPRLSEREPPPITSRPSLYRNCECQYRRQHSRLLFVIYQTFKKVDNNDFVLTKNKQHNMVVTFPFCTCTSVSMNQSLLVDAS